MEAEQTPAALAADAMITNLRDKLYRAEHERDTLHERAERLEAEIVALRLNAMPACDEKAVGIREHAMDALERFFVSLFAMREAVKRQEFYGIQGSARQLIESCTAIMFLDAATARPPVDDILPAIEGLYEIERLGWLQDRYGRGQLEAVETFLALEIMRRSVGLPAKAKEKDGAP